MKRQAWQLEPIFEYQCFEKLAFKQILLNKNSSCNVWKNWGYFRQIPEQSLKEINYLSQNALDSLWRDCLNSIKFSFILINFTCIFEAIASYRWQSHYVVEMSVWMIKCDNRIVLSLPVGVNLNWKFIFFFHVYVFYFNL